MSKKERILKEAAALFSKKGFNKTSAAEIAEAADTAQGTIFYHFSTKHGVLFEIYNMLITEYLSNLQKVAAGGKDGLDSIRKILEFHYAFSKEHWDEYTAVHRDMPFIRGHKIFNHELVRANNEKSIMHIKQAIERGIKDGSIRPDADADGYARLIKTTLIGLARITIVNTLEFSSSLDVITDFCVRALRNTGEAS